MKIFLFITLLLISCSSFKNVNTQNHNSIVHYPLDSYKILQAFANKYFAFNGKYHAADDLYGNAGTKVYSIANGKVIFSSALSGYGWLIIIEHDSLNIYSLYGHLSTKRNKVSRGESVNPGTIIAYLADDNEDGSGPIDGSGDYPYWRPHLHFGIREGQIADYPSQGDTRWMAGYTSVYPSTIGWKNPSIFLDSLIQAE